MGHKMLLFAQILLLTFIPMGISGAPPTLAPAQPIATTTRSSADVHADCLVTTASKWGIVLTVRGQHKSSPGAPIKFAFELHNGRAFHNGGMSYFDCEPIFHANIADDSGRLFALQPSTQPGWAVPRVGGIQTLPTGGTFSETDDLRKQWKLPERGTFYLSVSCPIDIAIDENDNQPCVEIKRIVIVVK